MATTKNYAQTKKYLQLARLEGADAEPILDEIGPGVGYPTYLAITANILSERRQAPVECDSIPSGEWVRSIGLAGDTITLVWQHPWDSFVALYVTSAGASEYADVQRRLTSPTARTRTPGR